MTAITFYNVLREIFGGVLIAPIMRAAVAAWRDIGKGFLFIGHFWLLLLIGGILVAAKWIRARPTSVKRWHAALLAVWVSLIHDFSRNKFSIRCFFGSGIIRAHFDVGGKCHVAIVRGLTSMAAASSSQKKPSFSFAPRKNSCCAFKISSLVWSVILIYSVCAEWV